jgi:mono/diheme cytochrome c family protein/cytochrome c5
METTQQGGRSAARPTGLRRALRWLGYLAGGLVALVALGAAGVYIASEVRLAQTYSTPEPSIVASTDPAVVLRGERLVHTMLVCTHCHGENLAGGMVIDDPAIGRVYGPNLTSGRGGIGSQRTDGQLARAIRNGVRGDGHSMLIMPVEDYVELGAPDLTAVVSYVRSVPPVDSQPPALALGPVGRLLIGANLAPVLSATTVEQGGAIPPVVPAGVTVEYGRYLARTAGCMGCHGETLSGGPIPGAPPSLPVPANITPAGQTKAWTDEDWARLLRTGRDPGGRQIDPYMPYAAYANMTDDEIKALITYLRTVPPKEFGGR